MVTLTFRDARPNQLKQYDFQRLESMPPFSRPMLRYLTHENQCPTTYLWPLQVRAVQLHYTHSETAERRVAQRLKLHFSQVDVGVGEDMVNGSENTSSDPL